MALQDNKYLTFVLGKESYAISILKIKEIIGIMPITKAPNLPDYVKGVINLRGKIIPLIDLRLKFGLDEREYDKKTSVIVVELETDSGSGVSGVVVDSVQEVMDIDEDAIEPPPNYGAEPEQDFLTGMGKIDEKVIMIVDVSKILSTTDIQELKNI